MALDVKMLGDICCQVVKVLKRRVQEGGVREALWSGCHLVTLVAKVAEYCCSGKKGSEIQELVDICGRCLYICIAVIGHKMSVKLTWNVCA